MKLAILCAALLLSACSNNTSTSIKGKDEIEQREQAEAKEKNSEEGKEDTEAKEDTEGDNSNGVIPEAGGVKADSYDFGTYEVNERYGDESFTNRENVAIDGDWAITQDKDTVTIYFFDYSTGDILKSTGKNNRWISKDERVLSKKFDSIPPELADYHFVNYSNTLKGYFRLKGSFMYRLFKQDVKKEVGYTYNYALVRTNLETKESTIIDKVSSDLLVYYSYFNVSGGGNGVGRSGKLVDTVLFVDDSEPIIDNSGHSISDGYFDKDTGEFFYPEVNYGYFIKRINVLTNEPLYDGADRKSIINDAYFDTLGGFESNGYIYLVDAPNAKDYERSPSEVYMYDSNLDLHASVPIPYDLNEVIQLVDSEQITLWKVLKYQDKPGLQLVTINK